MAKIYPVIMSGGSGTRLWPLSRQATPKQYLPLIDDTSLMEETLQRISHSHGTDLSIAPPTIICAAGHRDQVFDHCKRAGNMPLRVILEPVARNTAAVAAIAAAEIETMDPDGLVLLLPADHHVKDPAAFWLAINAGVPQAEKGYLTTLGIQPSHPETGYGYIRTGASLSDQVFKIATFEEKPDEETAKRYVESGDYYWNAGIFLFAAKAMLEECRAEAGDILEAALAAWESAKRENEVLLLDETLFSACRSESIDYAIMERTQRAAVIAPVDIGWNDIGSWDALSTLIREDGHNHGGDNTIIIDSQNSYARTTGPKVALVGVENLIVVATGDSVLVLKSDRSQDVKKVVEALKTDGDQSLL
ncbi:MAG: mannose-1-phosphate guanylyltransferase/mannose-6-phosphate isomerase [Pseudomonadota bacterium]